MSKEKQTYNPCDDCQYSYSKNNQESGMCKICEFAYFRDRKQIEAEWIYQEYSMGHYVGKCNICECEADMTKYCPNCGAKMKGV